MMGLGFRKVTKSRLAKSRPQGVFFPTGGKSVAEIVRDVAAAMREAGMVKETPRG